MNSYNVNYMAKVFCLKTEILRDPFAVISSQTLDKYDVRVQFGEVVSVITVTNRVDGDPTVYQLFHETVVNYAPKKDDYGEPMLLTAYKLPEHNKFPMSMTSIDVVASSIFPRFSRPTPSDVSVIECMLMQDDPKSKTRFKLSKMLSTELVCKILYHRDHPLKYVRFYKNNRQTGVEVYDRQVMNVIASQ
ncbi:ORF126 [Saltwater crocodilepox virus]|nr:RNA polymerase subunit RPO22 [Saltwater crocodilepox virus]AVD69461.1 RNA polymerase subunit RPO22 [Saltwater crocodilepox virus]QGT46564.1 ORF126 [Saltwater crocodilepox virus]QGT46780.1 ORF126 [Saltwater crocodilepox virus]QGT46996.1 ORF126 [Saltwater crocodilepox virus]